MRGSSSSPVAGCASVERALRRLLAVWSAVLLLAAGVGGAVFGLRWAQGRGAGGGAVALLPALMADLGLSSVAVAPAGSAGRWIEAGNPAVPLAPLPAAPGLFAPHGEWESAAGGEG